MDAIQIAMAKWEEQKAGKAAAPPAEPGPGGGPSPPALAGQGHHGPGAGPTRPPRLVPQQPSPKARASLPKAQRTLVPSPGMQQGMFHRPGGHQWQGPAAPMAAAGGCTGGREPPAAAAGGAGEGRPAKKRRKSKPDPLKPKGRCVREHLSTAVISTGPPRRPPGPAATLQHADTPSSNPRGAGSQAQRDEHLRSGHGGAGQEPGGESRNVGGPFAAPVPPCGANPLEGGASTAGTATREHRSKERQCFRQERHCFRARRHAFLCGLTDDSMRLEHAPTSSS